MNITEGEDKKPNYRMERIERLLHELKYECTRGMVDNEVDESIHFRFCVPISRVIPNGVIQCEFRTHPIPKHYMNYNDMSPHLKIVIARGD